MSITALTTIFTPAPSCLAGFWQGVWDWYGPPLITNDCLPAGFVADPESYFSPGRCPSGYAPVNTFINTFAGTITETTQTCCPTVLGFSAQQTPASPYPLCNSAYVSSGVVPMTSEGVDGKRTINTVTTNEGGNVNAWGIVIRFQATDFASSSSSIVPSPTSTSTPSSPTSNPKSGSTSNATPSSSSPTTQSSGGMSTGTKVGIGVGVTAGILALALAVAIGYIIGQRRKERVHEGAQMEQPGYYSDAVWQVSEMGQEEHWKPTGGRQELDGSERHETPGH